MIEDRNNVFNFLLALMSRVVFILPFCFLFASCSNILTTVDKFECIDSKGTLDDYELKIHRSFFAKSNLMKIPSKVEVLDYQRTICKETQTTIYAGEDCRGNDDEKQSLIFNKTSGKLEIFVSPSIIRRATCSETI